MIRIRTSVDTLDIEKMLWNQGYRYDIIHYTLYPSGTIAGKTYHNARSIADAKKQISRLHEHGNYGLFEVREHIFPWEPIMTRLKKRIAGVVYRENDRYIAREKYMEKLDNIKQEMHQKNTERNKHGRT